MDITLITMNGLKFTFPALPEKVQGRYSAKYQGFDIISQGAVKVPKGTDVAEFSWDGVFFGRTKRDEPIVRKNSWKEPNECVNILRNFMKNEEILNLIVTETWINEDVTVSSFQPQPVGAYGNIEYTITFAQKKPLRIYTTNEMNISNFVQKTRPRNDSGGCNRGGSSYTVKTDDTLWSIAAKCLGSGSEWPRLLDANAGTIEAAAKKHGMQSSDNGHWIWPGDVLAIPG